VVCSVATGSLRSSLTMLPEKANKGGEKGKKRFGTKNFSIFRRQKGEQSPQQPQINAAHRPEKEPSTDEAIASNEAPMDVDTINSLQRYEESKSRLKESLKFRRKEWGLFEFPELDAMPEEQDSPKLQIEISKILDARKNSVADGTTWSKAKAAIEHVFKALSPFAKNFLMVAKEGQSVLLCPIIQG
jgi:hypothetical protein